MEGRGGGGGGGVVGENESLLSPAASCLHDEARFGSGIAGDAGI